MLVTVLMTALLSLWSYYKLDHTRSRGKYLVVSQIRIPMQRPLARVLHVTRQKSEPW